MMSLLLIRKDVQSDNCYRVQQIPQVVDKMVDWNNNLLAQLDADWRRRESKWRLCDGIGESQDRIGRPYSRGDWHLNPGRLVSGDEHDRATLTNKTNPGVVWSFAAGKIYSVEK